MPEAIQQSANTLADAAVLLKLCQKSQQMSLNTRLAATEQVLMAEMIRNQKLAGLLAQQQFIQQQAAHIQQQAQLQQHAQLQQIVPNQQPNSDALLMLALQQQLLNQQKLASFQQVPTSQAALVAQLNATAQQLKQPQPQQQQPRETARYKTEMCRPFEENGFCKYGDKCQFAHGNRDMRSLSRHPKYKTDFCRTFHTTGFCPYGPRCHFIHNEDETKLSGIRNKQTVAMHEPIQSPAVPTATRPTLEKLRLPSPLNSLGDSPRSSLSSSPIAHSPSSLSSMSDDAFSPTVSPPPMTFAPVRSAARDLNVVAFPSAADRQPVRPLLKSGLAPVVDNVSAPVPEDFRLLEETMKNLSLAKHVETNRAAAAGLPVFSHLRGMSA